MKMELDPDLARHLPEDGAFDHLMDRPGEVFREVKDRRTVRFEAGGRAYFLKTHRGCGWREIFKNLLQGKRPVLGADPEWEGIAFLERLGVPTMKLAGRGWRGRNPARRESFIVTEELAGMISLAVLREKWGTLEPRQRMRLKRALLARVAEIARLIHSHGMNHRDFYLYHFLVRDRDWAAWNPADPLVVHLIDLHRVQFRDRVPRRWLVKDLGGLLFSSLDCGFTERDLLRFVRAYRERPLRETLPAERALWDRVRRNAYRLYASFHGFPPSGPGSVRAAG